LAWPISSSPPSNAHDVTLIHYDGDFEIAAEVLPFRHQWVLEKGAI
jgi:hypothetical protein